MQTDTTIFYDLIGSMYRGSDPDISHEVVAFADDENCRVAGVRGTRLRSPTVRGLRQSRGCVRVCTLSLSLSSDVVVGSI